MTPGERIRAQRVALGTTVDETAAAAGISGAYLRMLEADKRGGSLRVLRNIAKALRCSLAEITGTAPPRSARSDMLWMPVRREGDAWTPETGWSDGDLVLVARVTANAIRLPVEVRRARHRGDFVVLEHPDRPDDAVLLTDAWTILAVANDATG